MAEMGRPKELETVKQPFYITQEQKDVAMACGGSRFIRSLLQKEVDKNKKEK